MARLMTVVTLVAVLLGLSAVVEGFAASLAAAFVWCLLPTPLVVFAIFGRRDEQAFAVGALVPWVLFVMRMPARTLLLPEAIWLPVLGGICGTVAVLTRRWIDRSGGD
jgi:hypothetical protein